jgi:hypothetical protein
MFSVFLTDINFILGIYQSRVHQALKQKSQQYIDAVNFWDGGC